MTLPQYPAHKSSGIEWLGMIPADWSVKALKYLTELRGRIGYRGYTTADIVDEGLGAITLSPSNMISGLVDFRNATYISWAKFEESPEIQLEKEDVVLVKTGSTYGRVAWVNSVPHPTTINPQIAIFKSIFAHKKWLFYLLQTEYLRSLLKTSNTGGTMPTMTQESVLGCLVPTPSYQVQAQIARFLDHETAKIDALIREQERLIKLLQEKRQAVISHAVTKGLDPDVPMKDSGVEWLGEVPAHWKMTPLKYLCSFSGGGTPSKENMEYWNGDIPWVSPKDMKSFWVSGSIDKITKLAVTESSTSLVESNALLMVVRSGILQRTIPVSINTVEVTLNQDMKALRFSMEGFERYFAFLVKGFERLWLLEWRKQGATVESIEQEYLAESLIPVPSLKELWAIVNELSKVADRYESLEGEARNSSKLLRERRSALISAAVTGKIDVRSWREILS